jgi:hypothetical protein
MIQRLLLPTLHLSLKCFVEDRRQQRIDLCSGLRLERFQRIHLQLHGSQCRHDAVLIRNRWHRNLERFSVPATYTYISRCAVGALQTAQVSEQSGTLGAIGPYRFLVVYKANQLIARNPLRPGRPVAPAIRRFEGRAKAFARHLGFLLGDLLHVVEELEKHDPGEHGQAVQVAVEPLVLAHDVAAGLDDGGKALGGGQGLRAFNLGRSWHRLFFRFKKLFRRIQKLIRLSDQEACVFGS